MHARLGRRTVIAGAAGLAAGLAIGLRSGPGRADAALGYDSARHLLARTGFGPTPAEIRSLEGLDRATAVDRLLGAVRDSALTPPPPWLSESPAELRQAQRAALEAIAQAKAGVDGKTLQIVRPVEEQGRELRNWWVEEMLASDQPLTERLVLFWHNHFTSSFQKVRYGPALFRQNALFRQHALGSFASLLRAVARDPAMLIYLDGARSVARQPNENFARELLELFTLGEGHYGEADIKAAARAFTGWGVDPKTGHFVQRPPQHDDGEKTFLRHTGRLTGDDVIGVLLAHPRTAETIVEKLWREFVSLTPDPAEVRRLAAAFRADYEIKPLRRALLRSDAFADPANRAALIKSPIELIVGTVRVLGLPVPEKTRLVRMMQGLGQSPFDPPNVKGWAGGESWITTYTLLLRQQYLRRIVEASAVAPMAESMAPPMMAERRPVEGRSLRNAGQAVRLGPSLGGLDGDTLLRTLLARPSIDGVDPARPPESVVAAALLDTAYQLK